MARELVLLVQESSFGTPMTPTQAEMWTTAGAGTAGAGIAGFVGFYGRLDGGNSFTMRPRPTMVMVPGGGGWAVDAFRVADKLVVEGTYRTKLYAGPFTQFLLTWASQQINANGYVAAAGVSSNTWAYSSGPPGNLASVTILHYIQRADGTTKCRQYNGVRVRSWDFTLSENSTTADITLQLVGSSVAGNQWTLGNYVDPTLQTFASPATPPVWGSTNTATTWCAPSASNLPVTPYLFIHATPLTIGIVRTQFQSLGISCQNQLQSRFWNNRFAQLHQLCGRRLTMTAQNFYINMSPEDRLEYEGLVAQTVTAELNNGTHTVIFTLNTNNIITSLEDALPLEDVYTQSMTATSQIDPAYSQTDTNLIPDFQLAFT